LDDSTQLNAIEEVQFSPTFFSKRLTYFFIFPYCRWIFPATPEPANLFIDNLNRDSSTDRRSVWEISKP